jgi:pimeloyl-ACP methyl ester carboxylesterase
MPPRQPTQAKINWEAMNASTVPMLLLTGDADLYIPPAILRAVGKRVPKAEVVIVPEAGHPVFFEQPDAFNRIVLDFIKKNGS